MLLQMWLLARASGIGPSTTMAAIWAPLGASSVMGVMLFGAHRMGSRRVDDVTLLGTLICAGGAVYAGLLLALSPQWRSMVLNAGRALRKARI